MEQRHQIVLVVQCPGECLAQTSAAIFTHRGVRNQGFLHQTENAALRHATLRAGAATAHALDGNLNGVPLNERPPNALTAANFAADFGKPSSPEFGASQSSARGALSGVPGWGKLVPDL